MINSPSRKVLLVDDNEANRRLIRRLTGLMGIHLLEAGDGEQGVRLAHEAHPDVILMDLSLPVIDGLTAARQLKSSPDTARICIIALTAHAMLGDDERARAAGVDGYVTKPIDVVSFQAYLERLLSEAAP